MTKAGLTRACREIARRSKGWPVGIPMREATARALVEEGLARWAPPIWHYPKPVFAVALTEAGKWRARPAP